MITIFTIPKPFTERYQVIQRNAIMSWQQIRPTPEIILCGNEMGFVDICAQYGCLHLPEVRVNEYGTPRLDHAFSLVQAVAKNNIICYVNADIIFLSNFARAVQRIRSVRFLMVGRRWNLDLDEFIDFTAPSWEDTLQDRVYSLGVLQAPLGSDYFVFKKNTLGDLPPFVVGRPGWDNWMIYRARALKMPVIDATQACTAIHQNHDYKHVPGRYSPESYNGPEADQNFLVMGGNRTRFTLLDATHLLTEKKVIPALRAQYLKRRIKTLASLHPKLRPLANMIKQLVGKE